MSLALAHIPALLAVSAETDVMLRTMAVAISAGVLLIVVARKLGLPAIVLLLGGGVLLGPAVWGDLAPIQPSSLGDGLLVLVSLFVGLILFEGGLTLDVGGYRTAPTMIKRLLTFGVLITWSCTAFALWVIFDFDERWRVPVIAASLVIVTGPTVIAPLLKRVKVQPKLHSILHWEGVLIDPIGVFLALFCMEALMSAESETHAILNLAIRFGGGAAIGAAGGLLLSFVVKRKLVPEEMINVSSLAAAVLIFGLAEMVKREAGLLAVTVAGFVFGLSKPARLRQVREFKMEMTDLLIGTLFMLLAARLSFGQFTELGLRGVLVVAILMFVVRPLSILVCSHGQDLSGREKLFLSWIGPRGIVAASMASLFAIVMEELNIPQPKFVETFTYSVIIATIVLQGLSAKWVARLLGVQRPELTGWLIVGSHALARRVARFLSQVAKREVVLVDTNARAVNAARAEGLTAVVSDARDTALRERREMQTIGNMLALTDNEDLNVRLCQEWAEVVGSDRVFRCNPSGVEAAPADDDSELPGTVIWPGLPRPSLIAGELDRHEAIAEEITGLIPRGVTVLAALRDDRVLLNAPADADGAEVEGTALLLRRQANYLARAIRPELVITCEGRNLVDLIGELLTAVAGVYPTIPRDELHREISERERDFPTALGRGVLVPHGHSSSIDSRICAIGRVPEGVDVGASDGEPARIVFLLLSPTGDPKGHLATLAEIARLVTDEAVRTRLIGAPTPADAIAIVRSAQRA